LANKSKHQKLFDSALKTGDWRPAEIAHRAELLLSGASIRANRKQVDTFAVPADPLEAEDDIGPDLALDDIEAETPSECLRDAYEAYTKAGGNRFIREKVLAHFDDIEIEATDRAAQREAAEKLFPSFGEHLWDDEIFAPITEIKTWLRRLKTRARSGGYARPWGVNNGTRGFRAGVEPPPLPHMFRARHLTGQPYRKNPETGRIDLVPYKQWAHEQPAGPYPFEAKNEREANHLKRPVVSAEWDDREAAEQNARWLAHRIDPIRISPDGELIGDLPAKITRSLARLIRRRDQLEASSRRAKHDAPLNEIAVPVTNAQRERYKLAPYTTALRRPREMLISDPLAFEREHGLTGARRFMLYRRVWAEEGRPLKFGPRPMSTGLKQQKRTLSMWERCAAELENLKAVLAYDGDVTQLPTYYGYGPDAERKAGRPRKPAVPKKAVGRPRKYEDNAARQRAHYARHKNPAAAEMDARPSADRDASRDEPAE
jgi:hypothetical protein